MNRIRQINKSKQRKSDARNAEPGKSILCQSVCQERNVHTMGQSNVATKVSNGHTESQIPPPPPLELQPALSYHQTTVSDGYQEPENVTVTIHIMETPYYDKIYLTIFHGDAWPSQVVR